MAKSKIRRVLSFIYKHPLNKKRQIKAILRFISWQVQTSLNPKASKVIKYGTKSSLRIKKGLTGATGNYYCGLHDYEEMLFCLLFLRKEDLFLDIGANIGSYTVLVGKEVGCKSLSFEPAPNTFQLLKDHITLNEIEEICVPINKGVGEKPGTLKFTQGFDTVNHVDHSGEDDNSIEVPITSIDSEINLEQTCLAKIDVEGFETPVIKGMTRCLENEHLKAIIIELNGSGSRYGFDEEEIHQKLVRAGFVPCRYEPTKREITRLDKHGETNTIYLRDMDFVQDRIKTAPPFKINGISF